MIATNSHIHTPYSFSAFQSVAQAVDLARREGVMALGINDFYTTAGFEEFALLCGGARILPLFNLEFITLSEEGKKAGMLYNDPKNPGRIYVCGKGLHRPFRLSPGNEGLLGRAMEAGQEQSRKMIGKVNELLGSVGAPFRLDFQTVRRDLAKDLVRERHIARAVRVEAMRQWKDPAALAAFFKALYSGKDSKADFAAAASEGAAGPATAALENEIRNQVLKAGGAGYVEEDNASFLRTGQAFALVRDGGGVPCYPVLLDDEKGGMTPFEGDWHALAKALCGMGVAMVELIPNRNAQPKALEFSRHFRKEGFAVLLGTEHNAPDMIPLTPRCRGGEPLGEELAEIGYKGACVVAAHQERTARGGKGFTGPEDREALEAEGAEAIGAAGRGR